MLSVTRTAYRRMTGWWEIMTWKGCGRKLPWTDIRNCPGLCLEGLRRYKIIFSVCSRCLSWFWTRSLPSTSQKRCPFSHVWGTVVTDQCRSVFGHSEQLQFHNCCSFGFILSILQFILNIANLLHRPITETLDGHVCTRDLDAACSVVWEWNVMPQLTGYWRYSGRGCWEYLAC